MLGEVGLTVRHDGWEAAYAFQAYDHNPHRHGARYSCRLRLPHSVDSNGTAAGGQFVVNGVAQTGGHEIDVTPGNVSNTTSIAA